MRLDQLVVSEKTKLQVIEKQLADCNISLEREKNYTIIITKVQSLIEGLLESSRKGLQENISNIVTQALQEILNQPLEFKVEFEFKRKQPEAYFLLNGRPLSESYGGGVEDIVSSVLKIIFFHLLQIKGPLFLDEPGKWVDAESSIRFAQFLKQLSNQFGIQLFIVTHKSEIVEVADRIFEVTYVGEESRITNHSL